MSALRKHWERWFDPVKNAWQGRQWMSPDPVTHDYTARSWGHDCIFRPIDGGLRASITGWGRDIVEGDYLILPNDGDTSRYRIDAIRYEFNPPDMWHASASFAPRPTP